MAESSRWISVEERLPDFLVPVLVSGKWEPQYDSHQQLREVAWLNYQHK